MRKFHKGSVVDYMNIGIGASFVISYYRLQRRKEEGSF